MNTTQDKTKKTGYIYREAIIKKLSIAYEAHSNLIAANFNKVNSGDLSQLRQALLDSDARLYLTKTSLFKRFLKKLEKDSLISDSLGPTGLIFAGNDIVAISKVLSEFSKEHEFFKILGGFLEDKKLSGADFDRLSKLPSRQELIAKTVYSIKSPLYRFRAALEQPLRKLLLCLESAKQTKEKQDKGDNKQQTQEV